MLTIGLIGGLSWESSAEYYKLLNQGVERRVGGLASAKIVLSSVEFAEVTALQAQDRWDEIATILAEAAKGVEAAGADLLLMCTTSFHRVADQVTEAVNIPVLHLADTVAEAAQEKGVKTLAFLGTTFAMTRSLFTERLESHGLTVLLPPAEQHDTVNRIIYEELVHGRVLDSSRKTVVAMIDQLWDQGAEGVILGCTELELLIKQADSELPVFGVTTLHVKAALDRALA